ncbi:hypothetical protein SDC9_73180 [bioreactor metagenome]|jgi:hypothetical protein|uniref:Uncharacterized protein n=2 Tax=root TaxID=1 RepID=A0A562JL90_9FIRM|nr:hypothetical protein [Sedimentibacter saalensis]MEA5096853.1 hypothetical protein [Sedimentibacter saalensis]TWH83733.1 hypothetical protein LY60_00345 [Sedimentibacter saalensis]
MGMSQEEFKTALLKDYAQMKRQREKEYMDYMSIAKYRRNQKNYKKKLINIATLSAKR